ncbi:MAG: DUF2339 domain-containing protein [Verrucomicrobia bacterium]|nr:DUF2339 domain-containing protein [Verrucomicrobiota bacterium]
MEALIALLLIYLVIALIIFPIWAFIKIRRSSDEIALLYQQLGTLEEKLRKQPASPEARPSHVVAATTAPRSVEPAPTITTPAAPTAPVAATPPPLPTSTPPPRPPVAKIPAEDPLSIFDADSEPAAEPTGFKLPAFNWEQFMGVKLAAWLGGFALFLGSVFFVKLSIENNWIPPEVRVALGFLLGIGLVVGGVMLSRKRYEVTAQTLCASGIVTLYAITFACRSIYHFEFFGPIPTLALMVLITATAFLLAVRLDAKVVAILGILGGFLTPILLSTGHDNPLGLFAYIALLDAGLIAVALHRRWHFLVPLGVAGTIAMEIGWAGKFLTNEKTLTAMIVCLVFDALFLGAFAVARRLKQTNALLSLPVAALVLVSFFFAGYFIEETSAGLQPARLFTFVFLADACILALALLDLRSAKLHLAAGVAVFALLALWTNARLNSETLIWGLAFYFLFAVIHSAFPIVLARRAPDAAPTWWSQLFPPLALLLVLGPVLNTAVVSNAIWPAILLIDFLAIVLAWFSVSLIALAAVLVLTLVAAGAWIFKIPAELTGLPSLLVVIGGFALLFFGAGLWFARKFGSRLAESGRTLNFGGDFRAQLPAMSALLPFILLVMATSRLPLTNPTPIFGLALLLVVLTLGLTKMLVLEWLPACALAGMLALSYTWQANHFTPASASITLGWVVAFTAIFGAFPFVFRKTLAETRGPWITAAASSVLFFPLVFDLVKRTWPNDIMGLLPLAFALPAFASLIAVLRLDPLDHPRRLGRLALFGGVALFFITLIFPIQFDRQWITIGWALEGAALLWLFHRVPHRGLPIAGVFLLIAVFVRLALNPAVFSYHANSGTPILNWYLYTYGIAIACLLGGARLLAPPHDRVLNLTIPPIFNALGIVLLFLLVNIEIADFFSPASAYTLTFDFSGNLARDMSYTIAWALFALGLLVLGIWKKNPGARYTALGLLGVTLLKLFFHDLANLSQLYRIGALFAVAIIAILASFVYQRFLPADEKKK